MLCGEHPAMVLYNAVIEMVPLMVNCPASAWITTASCPPEAVARLGAQ